MYIYIHVYIYMYIYICIIHAYINPFVLYMYYVAADRENVVTVDGYSPIE